MPSKYGKEFAVPKEFPSVLKSFTREVLRAQPNNIYEFGATYFTELLSQAEAAAAADAAGSRKRLSRAELEDLLTSMFQEADADDSGALNLMEFKEVLAMADLGLADREAKMIMAEADMDGNGDISYAEFIPLAVELVHSMYAKMDEQDEAEAEDAAATAEAQDILLKGMSKEQVEQIMSDIFKKSDVDGSGALSITEFVKCCKDADIGLTRKEVNVLMHQCDVDGDGTISYDEFVPLCFEMLVEITKSNLLEQKRQPSELEEFLKEMWQEADAAEDGALPANVLSGILWDANLGLSRVQLHSICSTADFDDEGFVNYMTFAPKAAKLIYRMLDLDARMERENALQEMGGSDSVKGYSQGDLEEALMQLFAAADPAGSGMMTLAAVKQVLASSSLGLSDREISGVLSAAELVGDQIKYADIAKYAFWVWQYLAQEDMLGGG